MCCMKIHLIDIAFYLKNAHPKKRVASNVCEIQVELLKRTTHVKCCKQDMFVPCIHSPSSCIWAVCWALSGCQFVLVLVASHTGVTWWELSLLKHTGCSQQEFHNRLAPFTGTTVMPGSDYTNSGQFPNSLQWPELWRDVQCNKEKSDVVSFWAAPQCRA